MMNKIPLGVQKPTCFQTMTLSLAYFANMASTFLAKEPDKASDTGDIEAQTTDEDEEWVVVKATPFTEPLWGVVVNRT